MRLLPPRLQLKQIIYQRPDRRNPRRPANQHHLIDLRRRQPRILQRLLTRPRRPRNHCRRQLLKLPPRNLPQIPLRFFPINHRQRNIERRLLSSRQDNLRLNYRLANRLHRFAISANILAQIPPYINQRNRNQQIVDIVPTEVRIPTRGYYLKDPFMKLQKRNIKRPTAKVIYGNQAVFVLIQSISQRRRRRLIHQPQHLQPRNPPGILGSLALRIVKVGRNRNHGLRHGRTKKSLRIRLQLLQHISRDLRRRQQQPTYAHLQHLTRLQPLRQLERKQLQLPLHILNIPPHQPLRRVHCTGRVIQQRPSRRIPHHHPTIGPRHYRRHQPLPILPRNHHRRSTLHKRHQRIRRAQINPYNPLIRHRFNPFRSSSIVLQLHRQARARVTLVARLSSIQMRLTARRCVLYVERGPQINPTHQSRLSRKNTTPGKGFSLNRSVRSNPISAYKRLASGIANGTVSRYIVFSPCRFAHRTASSTNRLPSLNPRNAPSTQSRFISQPDWSFRTRRKATQPAATPSTSASNSAKYGSGSLSNSFPYPSMQMLAAPLGLAAR